MEIRSEESNGEYKKKERIRESGESEELYVEIRERSRLGNGVGKEEDEEDRERGKEKTK